MLKDINDIDSEVRALRIATKARDELLNKVIAELQDLREKFEKYIDISKIE